MIGVVAGAVGSLRAGRAVPRLPDWPGGAGVRARVTETAVSGDKILVGLAVTGTRDGTGTGENSRWQVLTVRDGRIAAIEGFDDRDEAAAWARLASA